MVNSKHFRKSVIRAVLAGHFPAENFACRKRGKRNAYEEETDSEAKTKQKYSMLTVSFDVRTIILLLFEIVKR